MSIVYDPTLDMLSIFVAIIGSLTGVAVTFGYGGSSLQLSPRSLTRGAVIIGGSIWSMHFIAMLAVKFPVPINYSSTETLLSLCVAVFFTGVGVTIANAKGLGLLKIPVAAVIMGSGIACMHYLGMNAIRGCGISYNSNWLSTSVAVAIGASGVALWFAFRKRGPVETLLGGVVLGLAIAGMHYTGMYATSFFPVIITFDVGTPVLSQGMLALSVAAATLVICGYYLFLFSSMLTTEET
jgi:NO-binding membrane sensor protein with MHYT domain